MKLILMTRPEFFVEEHQILTALFDEGLDTLHLRKPGTEPVLHERLISLIPASYRKQIVAHDHFYLKGEFGLRGIHLNSRNTELPQGYKGQLSCSCHSPEELAARSSYCDYMFLSPIFQPMRSGAFHGAFPPHVLEEMSRQKVINRKVMALGGVGLNNISELKEYGFGGVVVLGDIWNRFNLHNSPDFRDLITHFRKLKRAVD